MSKGKNSARKTVRMPATKLAHLQKKIQKNRNYAALKKGRAGR